MVVQKAEEIASVDIHKTHTLVSSNYLFMV